MKFTRLSIDGSWLIELEKRGDDRGFFARAYDVKEFADHGIDFQFNQTNISYCVNAGTIRGLHYQNPPYAEAKLMRCIRGKIFDVMIDLRKDSPSYLQVATVELSAEGREIVFIPAYCAHAYQALEDNTEVLYSASSPYTPGAEQGIRWNDPKFIISWPITNNVIVSAKDSSWPDYQLNHQEESK